MLNQIIFLFTILSTTVFSAQNKNSTADTLLVGYTTAPPFIVQSEERLEGINIWLWRRISKDLDLEYKMLPLSFSEMLDSLKTGGIDISINPLTITSDRNRKMLFTDSFYASNSTIAIAEVSQFQKIIQFVKGFLNQNFLKVLFVLLLIIFLFGMVGWYFERKGNTEHFRMDYKGIWDGIWWATVTLTTVGYGDKAPKTRMGKIAALN